jgi:dTDP-4-dehydrorhamnose 3,5-epimerase
MTLRFTSSEVPGVVIVEPDVHSDERGFLLESYHAAKYREGGIHATFVQDNHSASRKGTLRGLHGQSPHPQGKLVRVLEGTSSWTFGGDRLRTGSSSPRHSRARTSGRSTHRRGSFTDSWS